jgi:predicted amidophosphoribosyltransferase
MSGLTKASGSEKEGRWGHACQAPRAQHLTGLCPHCGQEMEFFTVTEIKNQRYCYHCKGKFDSDKFLTDLGLST